MAALAAQARPAPGPARGERLLVAHHGGDQALVNQHDGGKPQGNPNPVYYELAAGEYGAAAGLASCNSSNGRTAASSCAFYDVTRAIWT